MKITEIMSTKVDELKKEIIDTIDYLLITKGAEEIEIQIFDSFFMSDDYLVYKYNRITKSITFIGTEPFNFFESGVNELMELLKEVEEELYEITK